ncbi:MAG: permease-like cell division protein FtsX [Patescibacteria group bacterium]|nr:permease-like cell division protein FtsX [Patescibacteria group bacterium]
MLFTELRRIIISSRKSFTRGGFPSIAAILVMAVTLFFITSLFYVQVILTSSLSSIKDRVDITIYFFPEVNEYSINEVAQSLDKIPEVKSVEYISQEEALEEFKEKHANDYLTLQALGELSSNPLGASLNVRAQDPSQYEALSKYFESDSVLAEGSLTIIDKIDYHQNKEIIDKLNSVINGAKKLGFALSLVFILISILITFNTIGLIIYMSKEDISVMKLVGAGGKQIQGPFIVSGIIIGVLAAFLTIIIFWPISYWLGNNMANFLGVDLFSYYKSNFFQLFFIELTSGIILGAIASFFAIRRYLRK